MTKQLLTIEQLAEILNVPPSWVMEKGARGDIPSYRIGRYRRFDLDEVKAALKEQGVEAGKAA